jgi:hypothetical protein
MITGLVLTAAFCALRLSVHAFAGASQFDTYLYRNRHNLPEESPG